MFLAKVDAFGDKYWQELTLILESKWENLEFEKLGHLLNLLDFQLFSQQVQSRVVGNFKNINLNNYLRNSAMVGFYTSKGW